MPNGNKYTITQDGTINNSIEHSGIIPIGGIYTQSNGTILNTGDEFPATISDGDIYIYGDYEYHYNQYFEKSANGWISDITLNGWGVRVLDTTKQNYGLIIENICGKDITKLRHTFSDCFLLTTSPAIPSGVKWIQYLFENCENLTDISAIIIPNDTTLFYGVFINCTSLQDISTLKISENVTSIKDLFNGCSSLINAQSLVIPNSVTNMSGTFYKCSSLTYAPEIPNSVDIMVSTFGQCTNLNTVTINANPTTYDNCFFKVDMSKITLKGSSQILNLIGATGLNYGS